MHARMLASALLAGVALAGCSDMSTTQQRTLSGGAMGAAAGGVVGAIAGDTMWGAAVGAAAGAAGGYLYDRYEQSKASSYNQGYAAGKASSGN